MSSINLKCPVSECTYETGSSLEIVAFALLQARTTTHAATHTPSHHAPKLERPSIDIGVSAEEWTLFERRWKMYVRSMGTDNGDKTSQLFQCASSELGDAVLRTNNNIIDKSEEEMLATMKALAIVPVAVMVVRAELLAMRQDRHETIRSFFSKVRGKAEICSYSTQHKCQCGLLNSIDFTETIVRDVVIAGLYDEDIWQRIMSVKNLCDKSSMTLYRSWRQRRWQEIRSQHQTFHIFLLVKQGRKSRQRLHISNPSNKKFHAVSAKQTFTHTRKADSGGIRSLTRFAPIATTVRKIGQKKMSNHATMGPSHKYCQYQLIHQLLRLSKRIKLRDNLAT